MPGDSVALMTFVRPCSARSERSIAGSAEATVAAAWPESCDAAATRSAGARPVV